MDFFVSTRPEQRGWASASVTLYRVPLQEGCWPDWLQLPADLPIKASQHDDNSDSVYYEEEVISWDAVISPQSGLDLRDLLTDADTLQPFCSVGYTIGQELNVDCYVGELPVNCSDIVFTVKEHPIQDGAAHRDDTLQALVRVKAPFHKGYDLHTLPFSYAKGVIEVHASCEGSDLGLVTDMSQVYDGPFRKELSFFFVYEQRQ